MEEIEYTAEISVDSLAEEELEKLEKRIRETRLARKKAEQEKALAERKEKEKQLVETRKERAQEVEDAYKAVKEAREKADKLMAQFIADYKYYHKTFVTVPRAESIFDTFFEDFFRF